MSQRSSHMATAGSMGLARQHCSTCAEETIHKFELCVHCGTNRNARRHKDPKSGKQWYREANELKRGKRTCRRHAN